MIPSTLALSLCAALAAPPPSRAVRPADSVVQVLATVRFPDPTRPWAVGKAQEVSGSGVVLAGNRILTNAHVVEYARPIYVRARPGGAKVKAEVQSIAFDLDLAVLQVADKRFFDRRPPLPRTRQLPAVRETVEVYGFPIGGTDLSVTKGVVSRIGYGPYYAGITVQVSAAINRGNSGGPAVVDGRMVGVAFSRLQGGENIGYVIPNEEIDLFLDAARSGGYTGRPTDATRTRYQRLENETLRAMLKLDGQTRGLLVTPRAGDRGNPYRPNDVLTRIGDHAIDNDGMVRLGDGLRVPFYGVIPRLARGDRVPVTVLRGGKPMRLSLPVTARPDLLIPYMNGQALPYFIHGPLVFAPARDEAINRYMDSNLRLTARSPLEVRRFDRVAFPGEELVVVTSPMFRHEIAEGYFDPLGQVLAEFNGTKVRNLRHLVELLRDSRDEFLRFRFVDEQAELLVFRRQKMSDATAEILEDNSIPETKRGSKELLAVFNQKPAAKDKSKR